LIPLLVGEHPFVADAFNLNLMSQSNDDFRNLFEKRLNSGYFGSVVLKALPGKFARDVTDPMDPLLTARLVDLVAHDHLVTLFAAQIQSQYRVVFVRRPYVYFLRNDLPFAPMPPCACRNALVPLPVPYPPARRDPYFWRNLDLISRAL
jgi:hypothetical protein